MLQTLRSILVILAILEDPSHPLLITLEPHPVVFDIKVDILVLTEHMSKDTTRPTQTAQITTTTLPGVITILSRVLQELVPGTILRAHIIMVAVELSIRVLVEVSIIIIATGIKLTFPRDIRHYHKRDHNQVFSVCYKEEYMP